MRLLHVTCLYPPEHAGGAARQCRRIALGLRDRGHQVSVFSGRRDPRRPMLEVEDRTLDDLPVRTITTTDGFPEGDPRNWNHPAVEDAFARFVVDQRPEVVHFHAIQGLGASLVALAKELGTLVVVTMHDLWWFCARNFCVDRDFQPCIPVVTPGSCQCEDGAGALTARNAFLRSVFPAIDLVLTPSEAMAERLAANGLDRPLEVDPNGVDRLPVGEACPRPDGAPLRIVFTGGGNLMKGVHVLVPALRRLAEHRVPFEADLYGIDPYLLGTPDALDGLPARSHPPFPPERVDEVLAGGDVLVLPSVMFESSSLTVREALARHMAVVATETGGPEEVIDHGVNGLLVPPRNSAALADALRRLINSRETRLTLGEAAFQTAKARFGTERAATVLSSLVDEIVVSRRSA